MSLAYEKINQQIAQECLLLVQSDQRQKRGFYFFEKLKPPTTHPTRSSSSFVEHMWRVLIIKKKR